MSRPASRLSAFRSYSYYHVLVMCDSSNTADLLAKSTHPDVWLHATPETRAPDTRPGTADLGKYSPKYVYDENGQPTGRYIVLIDGARDAAYTIEQARWTSATAAAAVPGDATTSLAVEGSISISEPRGVAFLDQVIKCSVALGVDSSQVVYALKTFFVGFTYDPTMGDVPEHITDIPPVNFITYDVTGNFSVEGGKYEMMFVAVANGASRLPQYSKAVNSMNITAGDTLASTMTRLQDNIRASYTRYFSCVRKQLENTGTLLAQDLLNSLCEVNYVIEVSPEYMSDVYKVTDQPAQYKNTAGCNDQAKFTFPPNTSIETAIATIMQACPRVKEEMSKGDADGIKYEYKIHTCVNSKPITNGPTGEKKFEYSVVYRVVRTMTPKAIVDSPFEVLAQDEDKLVQDSRFRKIKQNIIEFDYIYTGKNIDILDFDIQVNMGLAYLQTATLVNTFKDQNEILANKFSAPDQLSATTSARGKFSPVGAVQTPVFFGKHITNTRLLNAQDPNASIQGAYTLSKHASLEVSDATVRIVGNDRLLATTNQRTSAQSMIDGDKYDEKLVGQGATEADFKHWNYVPAYAKINIKMPRDNDDFALFSGQTTDDGTSALSNADYARDFWFDGYYYVVGVDHVFDRGEFTQTLSMVGIPKASAAKSTQVGDDKNISFDTKVSECFDDATGCGKPAQSTPTVTADRPVAVLPAPAPQQNSYTKNDADSILTAPSSLDKVKGWSKSHKGVQASSEVKQAIVKAGGEYGIDPVVLAQFCYQESKFNPRAKAPTSSATGLFQFIDGSWSKNTIGTDHNITPAVLANKDNRYDPQLNAYAAARYLNKNARIINSSEVGDLYLAHFLGAGGARYKNGAWAIIEADRRTNGTATVMETLGFATTSRLIRANPGVITAQTTVGDLRAWAANKMAQTLINPVDVVTPIRTRQEIINQATTPRTLGTPTEGTLAKDKVSSQQDCKVVEDEKKKDEQPCAKKPDKFTEDRAKSSQQTGIDSGSSSGAEIGS